jgi:hypothetical protein
VAVDVAMIEEAAKAKIANMTARIERRLRTSSPLLTQMSRLHPQSAIYMNGAEQPASPGDQL